MDIKRTQENSEAVKEKSANRNTEIMGEEAQGYTSKSESIKFSSLTYKINGWVVLLTRELGDGPSRLMNLVTSNSQYKDGS